jgi:glycosyltransferase involved in cell wall biosynthesis
MKIIQYIPYSYHIHTWWLEKIAQTLSEWLNEKTNIELINITSNIRRWWWNHKSYNDTIFIPSFDLVYNFPIPIFWWKDFWAQFKKIQQYKPDIIITHTRFFIQSMMWGIIAKRFWCKWVHIEHWNWFLVWYSRYIKLCAFLFDWTIGLWIFRQCNCIITISNAHTNFIKKFTNKKPIIIYNPIDFLPKPNIKNNIVHIWFLASLLPRKWCSLLLYALSWLKESEWKCTIVGDGKIKKDIERITVKLWLINRITFVGADDRTNRLHKFDIFVNPSYQEGLPTTVVEALLAKCIVVATDVGGTSEISNQEDLILCQPWNIEDIRKKIVIAFSRLDKKGSSFNIVQKKFSPKETINKYSKILSI